MADNFSFLKKVNSDLYKIIDDAEKLYRDEYFEQCMAQTRRFGEQICKNMLEENDIKTGTFDEMLAALKDRSNGSIQEKEFIDDLYFLKKNGNESIHSGKVKKDAMTALECLKRSFEAAINYCVYNQGASTNILKLNYDIELLITNKKSKASLKEKYEYVAYDYTKEKKLTQALRKSTNKCDKPCQTEQIKPKISVFGKLVIFLTSISVFLIIVLHFTILLKRYY